MKLSNKHTTAYVVMATWPDAKIETWLRPTEARAEKLAADVRDEQPEAFVQVHRIQQALPKAAVLNGK